VKHRPSSRGAATTQFDSAVFNEVCKARHPTKQFECPELDKFIETLTREGFFLSA
jgi:hypothetical protein